MTSMIKYIILIAFFSLMLPAVKGTPFTIVFQDGTQLRIHNVERVNESFTAWQHHSNPLKDMFFTYNYPESLEAYKRIFYKQGYPAGIDTIYAAWRPRMNTITMNPQSIFHGMLDSMEVACIQYSYTYQGDQIQMSFLAKRVEGKWYPVGSAAMAKYQPVMAVMATLQPEFVACMLTPDPQSPSNAAAQQLREGCMSATRQITEACLYQMAEKWGMSEQPLDIQQERLVFKNRMSREMPESRRASMNQALTEYVHSLGLPEEGTRRALYYFSKNETMKAIWILRVNGLQADNTTFFSALTRIQETSQFRSITYKPQETPKSN